MKPAVRRLLPLFLLALALASTACRTTAPTATVPAAPPSVTAVATAVGAATSPAATPAVATPTIPLPAPAETTPATATRPGETPLPVTPPPVLVRAKPAFAQYDPRPVSVTPAIYHEPIAPDLGNVVVPFVLSPLQRERLAQDGIVVSPSAEKEFFTVYELARYNNLPQFVTSDSLLHVYHLLFDKVLRTAERDRFIPLLAALNQALLEETDAQYQALRGTAWEDAALRAVAFIGVGARLLQPDSAVPAYAEDLVAAELALISAADGIHPSPIFPGLSQGEDYTQYIPRGHYTRSEALSNYFRSMMWFGRMTFRLKGDGDPQVGRAETRSALLLVRALQNARVQGQPATSAWLELYNPTVFFVGRSDDLTALQYADVAAAIYGDDPSLQVLSDEARLDSFIAAAYELPPPRILGLVIMDTDDVEETTKGFRFMGQRFVPDAYVFRQLIYRNVGTRENPRALPMGLDLLAAMGSERAYAILDALGETDYANYPQQMAEVRTTLGAYDEDAWTETLYNSWLYTFFPLLDPPGTGYPQFMQSQAWQDKQLNTALGSWAELKHDTILYAKQVYAELGGGGGGYPLPELALGYVEPVPAFFSRLGALARMTREGLAQRDLLSAQDEDSLLRIEQLATALQTMAEKELRGEPLSDEEHYLIRFYGGELEHLVMAAADRADEESGGQPFMEEEPQAAVVADVATNPATGEVLEEGVGRIDHLYAVVPLIRVDGSVQLQVARGGVFSYYEFAWPMADRLDDDAWRSMLDNGTAPPRPSWIDSFFTPETEYAAVQRAVYRFQEDLSPAYWNLCAECWLQPATPAVVAQFEAIFDRLRQEKQYVGHQWVRANYRSFDLQNPDLIVVTVRETWLDSLYDFAFDPGDANSEHLPVAERGPYTLDVTYTLQRQDDYVWTVSNVVFGNEAPAWESLP